MPNNTTPKKSTLNLPTLISLVMGNMIGTGIFILPASLAAFGSISILSWLFTGIGAVFLALTFTRLNQKYPRSGGAYVYCKEAYGDFVGFLVAYTYWISLWVATAGIAVASIGYLGVITHSLDQNSQATYHPMLAFAIEVAAVWFFTLINIRGIRTAGFVQLLLTIIKIGPLLLITAFGFFKMDLHHFTQFNLSHQSNLSAMTGAAALTFWAFIGLETATVPADHTSGSRNVFRATMFGTIFTTIIYLLSTIALMGLIAPLQLQNSASPFADAVNLLFGHNLAYLMAIFAILAGFGTLNVCILMHGQIPYAAARDHLFPKTFAKVSRFDTPWMSLVISAGLVTLILTLTISSTLMNQFNLLALLATLATLATYFMCTVAELVLLSRQAPHFNRFTLIKSSVITVLAGAYAFWMILSIEKNIVLYGALLLLTGLPIYFWLATKRKKIFAQLEPATSYENA